MKLGSLLEAGLAGGMFGGLVGLGSHGGMVTLPALKTAANFSATLASGTAHAAVLAIGLAGSFAFASSDKGYFGFIEFCKDVFSEKTDIKSGIIGGVDAIAFLHGPGVIGKVDFYAAGIVGTGTLLGLVASRGYVSRFSPTTLQRFYGLFQVVLAPLVPVKGYFARQKQQEKDLQKKKSVASWGDTYKKSEEKFMRAIELIACGAVAGGAFAMLGGVGGGVVVTPMLCLITDNMDHATVLGTTLTAMLPVGFITMVSSYRSGNMCVAAALPLSLAAAFGSFFGAKLACDSSDETLQVGFGAMVFALGMRRMMNPGI